MIDPRVTFIVAFTALRLNKTRSFLTMLGIIIGVGAIITMLAVGSGASVKIDQQITAMGSNLLIIMPGATTSGGAQMGMGSQPSLTLDDVRAIRREVTAAHYVAPIDTAAAPVVSGVAALMMASNSRLTADDVKTILENTADKVGSYAYVEGRNDYYGYGKINAAAAVAKAKTYR